VPSFQNRPASNEEINQALKRDLFFDSSHIMELFFFSYFLFLYFHFFLTRSWITSNIEKKKRETSENRKISALELYTVISRKPRKQGESLSWCFPRISRMFIKDYSDTRHCLSNRSSKIFWNFPKDLSVFMVFRNIPTGLFRRSSRLVKTWRKIY